MISDGKVSTIAKWGAGILAGAVFANTLLGLIFEREFEPKVASWGTGIVLVCWLITFLFYKYQRFIFPEQPVIPYPALKVSAFFIGIIIFLWIPFFVKDLKPQKVEILLDVSTRMGAEFDKPGTTRLDAAKAGILQVLSYLEGKDIEVALRLVSSKSTTSGQCSLEPKPSLAVDFTQDFDKIRKVLETIEPLPSGEVPLVKAIDLSISHYRQNKVLNQKFYVYSFIGGNDTCGDKVAVFLDSPLVRKYIEDTDIFLIILRDTEEGDELLRDIPNARLDYASSMADVKQAVQASVASIEPPTPEPVLQGSTVTSVPAIPPTLTALDPVTEVQPMVTSGSSLPVANMEIATPKNTRPPAVKKPSSTAAVYLSPVPTSTPTQPPSVTASLTRQPTLTATRTSIPTFTPTEIFVNIVINTATETATFTPTNTPTETPTDTPTPVPTLGPQTMVFLAPQPDVFLPDCTLLSRARAYSQFYRGLARMTSSPIPNGSTNQGISLQFSNISGGRGDYAGWEVWLGDDDSKGIDLSPYTWLTFYVRGAAGGETPNVWLMMPTEDQNYHRFWRSVPEYTPLSTNWTEVKIPLLDFTTGSAPSEQISLRNIQKIQIVFEWYEQGPPGEIFIDDLCVR